MHVGRIHNATTHGPAGQSSTRVTSTSEAQHAWPCCAPCISPRSGRWRRRHCCACCPLRPCWRTIFYTEKAPNAWHRRRTHRTGNTYNQPNRPNRLTSQTKHQALPKGQPGRRTTPINTAAVHASAQKPNIISHTRHAHHQILSAYAARCEAHEQYMRAG